MLKFMNMKKKIISIISALILAVCAVPFFSACKKDDRPIIAVTVYPIYDWVSNVLGEKKDDFNLILLQDNGADLHNYDPTSNDIGKIADSVLFIYVGGESDERWTDRVFNAIGKEKAVINLLEVLGDNAVIEEEVGEEDHDHEHEEDHDHEEEYDEHVWLSLNNAKLFVTKIVEKLSKIDVENAETYKNNATGYVNLLDELNEEYKTAVDGAEKKVIVVADRFPFIYMTKDYGITYHAAFSGCSSDSAASTGTITRLVNAVLDNGLDAIFKLEGSDGRTASSVKSGVGRDVKILTLDSMQTTTLKNGKGYLTAMRNNLDALKIAFNVE